MPIVKPDEIEKLKTERNTIREVLGGFQGPYLPHVYDNRSEALRENCLEADRQRLAKEGKNINMQTPAQEKAYAVRKEESEKRKQKAAYAAEMMLQNK